MKDERCNSKGPRGIQCCRSLGHEGEHMASCFIWEDDDCKDSAQSGKGRTPTKEN